MHIRSRFLTHSRTIILGFICIILFGALLLMLPCATRAGERTSFGGALFTAVSSTCVTGLVVYDTWTHWTLFGQLVLLTLIQIGGLGFITIVSFAMILLRRRIGINRKTLIQESLSTLQLRGSVRLVRRIILGTLIFEGAGALLLAARFVPDMGLLRGLYYGVFHSVSAFCNAGFDLMGYRGAYGSFCAYFGDPCVVIALCMLILIGGLGFVVWEDLWENKLHWKKYALQTKIVLSMTVMLTLFGALLFLLAERNKLFSDMKLGEKLLASLFCAVTPRTAGFNTVDTAALSNGSFLLTLLLMFIGGCPGSTAGGVKTTTFFVVLLYVRSYVLRRHDCEAFHCRLYEDAVRKASTVIFINLMLIFLGSLTLCLSQELPLRDVLFEVFSATGTVGMSTGITRQLNTLSRIAVMFLMFLGRMGSLTFAMSLSENLKTGSMRCCAEQIVIG